MDNKRKAHSYGALAADDGRAAKRQKVPPHQQFDLFQGESAESTTQYGFHFIDQIRRTSDKSGRLVAGHFEHLPPVRGNEDYYQRTRMPISIQSIEQKLHDRYFNNMTELESYVKRMVQNAKDYFEKTSDIFDDAERVRKATSNYMVKHNPAYKLIPNYTATPTPFPDNLSEPSFVVTPTNGQDVDAEGEDEMADDDDDDQDADGDEDDDAEADSDEDVRGSGRRGSGRPSRNGGTPGHKDSEPPSATSKPDHQYEDVPYKGLTFQQAQEKVIEELIRKSAEEDDQTFPYFIDFHNLPPRSLKDYYMVIKDPTSLKKLQKQVKGVHGRGERSGSTEFRTWAAFEEKASKLWENAYLYNEDGSDISLMAKELETMFYEQLKEAKAAVEDPAPKIILKGKVPSQDAAVAAGSNKVTITFTNKRGSSTGSPAPQTGGPVSSEGPATGALAPRPAFNGQYSNPSGTPLQVIGRSLSGAVPTPSPLAVSARREELARMPAMIPRPNGVTPGGYHPPAAVYNSRPYASSPLQNGHPPPTVPLVPTDDQVFRPRGQGVADALITSFGMRTHPGLATDRRFRFQLPPHPKLAQQSVAVNIPVNQWKQQIMVSMAPSILAQQRHFKLFVIINGATMLPTVPPPNDPIEPGAKLYDATLSAGMNTIQVHLAAALPKAQRLPNGPDAQVEKITVLAHVLKH